ncbi:hypothetical protein FLP10_04830 [Agromyces intestinalis]|uniref:Uncharacterized protein n=1 Tax=Agromyces intestinalis TaxID=2592652 RepID=A0A5C1YCQ4_9MICO|nr:hypothetical protein [Agromyces intestinalis]QEO13821.1 hypothetical protein FLP10_04830 [Agromyces intestinalis]
MRTTRRLWVVIILLVATIVGTLMVVGGETVGTAISSSAALAATLFAAYTAWLARGTADDAERAARSSEAAVEAIQLEQDITRVENSLGVKRDVAEFLSSSDSRRRSLENELEQLRESQRLLRERRDAERYARAETPERQAEMRASYERSQARKRAREAEAKHQSDDPTTDGTH